MSLTESSMPALGDSAHDFDLPAANPDADDRAGDTRALEDFADADVLVVVFTCNHCPYAQHVEPAFVELAEEYQRRGVAFVAISSNDAKTHPQDSFENMAERADAKGYPFPYLYDETQEVARAYGAACTPDFFVYDADRALAYRGRFDATRPNKGTPTGEDLRTALDELLADGEVQAEQYPSIGCNIKWKA
jgi:peroxiredoxin